MSENKNGAEAAKRGKSWFKGLKAEYNKIIWENKETVTKQTISVVSISVVVGILIAVIDMILQYGIDFLIKL